jgi:AAHS family 4-hydroxybenzoate transporter-like MFS transporter
VTITAVRPADVINHRAIGGLQILVFALCACTVFVDGYDTQAVAYIAPVLSKAWALRPGALGPVFAAALLGSALGSLLLAPLSDLFGRKRLIVWSSAAIGVLTLACGSARSIGTLELLRFQAGLALGATLPNAIALIAEYAPERRRTALVTATFCGYAVGAAFGALAGTLLVPHFGWPSVFQVGGVVTLILCPVLQWLLPESLLFLALAAPRGRESGKTLGRLLRSADAASLELVPEAARDEKPPIAQLFRSGRATITLLFGALAFLTLLELYLLNNWLPTLIHGMGFSVSAASWATATFQLGGISGIVCLGLLVDRWGTLRVIPAAYLAAAVSIVCIAFAGLPVLMNMATFSAGFMIVGCQGCNNAVLAGLYPTSARATGMGLNLAIGRVGSIIGPSLTGLFLSMNISPQSVLLGSALPTACAALVMFWAGLAVTKLKLRQPAP